MSKITCDQCGEENPSTSKFCAACGFVLPKPDINPSADKLPPDIVAKKRPSNTIPGVIVGVVMFFVMFYAVQHYFFSEPLYDKAMTKIASEINKETPMMVDEDTRLDNAIALPGNVFQYNYTIISAEVQNVDVQALKNYLEPIIINAVTSDPQMQYQRDHKTTMNYNYKDKNGRHMFLISVTPEKYL